jgi:hypothetical protein
MFWKEDFPVAPEVVAQLCPQCALCCNGVLFKDVELQPADDAERLTALGLPVAKSGKLKFPQPCAALDGCKCRIYSDRPARCRHFECALLKSLAAGDVRTGAALRIIGDTKALTQKVIRLLLELGDADEHLALSLRFKRTKRRLEGSELDTERAERFGELTLAVHDLHLRLREHFYPG